MILLWSLMSSTRAVQSTAIFYRIQLQHVDKSPSSGSCLCLPNTPWRWLWHVSQFLIILRVSSLMSRGLKSSCKVVWGFLRSWFGQITVAKLTLTIATKKFVMLYCLKYSYVSCCTSELWLYNQRYKRKGVMTSCISFTRKEMFWYWSILKTYLS